jgi:hypothetical protein
MEQQNTTYEKNLRKISARAVFAGFLAVAVSALIMLITAIIRFETFGEYGAVQENDVIGYLLLFCALAVLLAAFWLYIIIFHRKVAKRPNHFAALIAIFTVSYAACLLLGAVSPLAMPLILAPVLYMLETNPKRTMPATFFLAAALGTTLLLQGGDGALPETVFVTLGTLTGGAAVTVLMRKEVTRLKLIGFSVAAGIIALPIYMLVFGINFDAKAWEWDFMWCAVGIFAAPVLTLLLQPVIDWVFNLTSVVRLIEICNMNHPLLTRLSNEASGTFHHCVTVATLAEECAIAIGENRYMARAAGLFHDVGKLESAEFFSENQKDDGNPHDEVAPELSCDIIRSHAKRGAALCAEHRLPEEIASAASEHHGTLSIFYFYAKAAELNDGKAPDLAEYKYPGPLPRTKINAIVMICDGAEAALRALGKSDVAAVRGKVDEIINLRIQDKQFDECPITFRDLTVIRDVIVEVFCGLRHNRVKYEGKKY